MTLMFDSPLGKKLTESETVIAALVVEDITAWLHEQKLPLYVALRFSGTLAHYTGIGDSVLDMRISSVLLFWPFALLNLVLYRIENLADLVRMLCRFVRAACSLLFSPLTMLFRRIYDSAVK